MTPADWPVWPIFTLELIIFLLFFIPSKARFLKVPMRAWVIILLLIIDIGIALSLIHDSTETLNLYF